MDNGIAKKTALVTGGARGAIYERQVPGRGELPLISFLAALPPDVVVGVEVPMKSADQEGVTPLERARLNLTATQDLIRLSEGGGNSTGSSLKEQK